MSNTRRAFVMFSGGLDSLLTARFLQTLGVEVVLLHFRLPFSGRPAPEDPYVQPPAPVSARARELGVEVVARQLGQDFIEMLKDPAHGRGKAMNPCVDCKIHMLRKARQLMERFDISFVATGEVLGQRPMSQRRDTLRIIERDSGMDGYLLRPLTAKNLKPTKVEELGWVDRERLLGFRGRSRKPQIELARELGISNPPGSAGGCLLTDASYGRRLKARFDEGRPVTVVDMHVMKFGRHFKGPDGTFLVVSRKEQENEALDRLARLSSYPLLVPEGWPGPVVLLESECSMDTVEFAARAAARYGKPPLGGAVFRLERPAGGDSSVVEHSGNATEEELERARI